MIPYWNIPTIPLGPFTISIWGAMVALGVLVGAWVAGRRAGERKNQVLDVAFWCIVAGFIGARLGEVLFYDPQFYFANPAEIVKVWHGGLSSYGGFFGAAIVLFYFYHLKPLRAKRSNPTTPTKTSFWHDADSLAWGFASGWTVARIGCFLTHIHPGIFTNFILGVRYPDGVRHDLGLYDAILAFSILIIFLIARRNPKKTGWYARTLLIIYPIVRFFLDFLRAGPPVSDDLRYFNLTVAQYGSILLLVMMLGSIITQRYGKISSPKNSV